MYPTNIQDTNFLCLQLQEMMNKKTLYTYGLLLVLQQSCAKTSWLSAVVLVSKDSISQHGWRRPLGVNETNPPAHSRVT